MYKTDGYVVIYDGRNKSKPRVPNVNNVLIATVEMRLDCCRRMVKHAMRNSQEYATAVKLHKCANSIARRHRTMS